MGIEGGGELFNKPGKRYVKYRCQFLPRTAPRRQLGQRRGERGGKGLGWSSLESNAIEAPKSKRTGVSLGRVGGRDAHTPKGE